jgi:type II secretory pathway pseudopilin PulG
MSDTNRHRRHARRALALPEVVAAVVVVAVLLSLLTVAGWRTRAQAMAGRDLANLRQVAGWTQSYVADSQDQLWGFWWRAREQRSTWPDLNNALSNLQAAADQAIDILRRRGGRVDIASISGWIPHIYMSHLPLLDYAGPELPHLGMVSALDIHRMKWARDPQGHDPGAYQPYQEPPTGGVPNSARRHPYSSSFQLPPDFFDQSAAGRRMTPLSHLSYSLSDRESFFAWPASTVRFPAQKAFVHSQAGWYGGRRSSYYAHEESIAAVLMADGSAGVRRTADSNEGWQPNRPTRPDPTRFAYQPRRWEPPTLSGGPSEVVTGHYRWTRGGIKGIDFGGPEINTGQR